MTLNYETRPDGVSRKEAIERLREYRTANDLHGASIRVQWSPTGEIVGHQLLFSAEENAQTDRGRLIAWMAKHPSKLPITVESVLAQFDAGKTILAPHKNDFGGKLEIV